MDFLKSLRRDSKVWEQTSFCSNIFPSGNKRFITKVPNLANTYGMCLDEVNNYIRVVAFIFNFIFTKEHPSKKGRF